MSIKKHVRVWYTHGLLQYAIIVLAVFPRIIGLVYILVIHDDI